MNGHEKIEKELQLDDLYYRSDILVTIKCDGHLMNCLLRFDGNKCEWVWDYDWWEGEDDVELIGAIYLDEVFTYKNKLVYRKKV